MYKGSQWNNDSLSWTSSAWILMNLLQIKHSSNLLLCPFAFFFPMLFSLFFWFFILGSSFFRNKMVTTLALLVSVFGFSLGSDWSRKPSEKDKSRKSPILSSSWLSFWLTHKLGRSELSWSGYRKLKCLLTSPSPSPRSNKKGKALLWIDVTFLDH